VLSLEQGISGSGQRTAGADNTKRQASSQEVNDLCQENEQAKQATYQSCADNIDKTSRTDYIRSANSLVV
jgi:hypothetical protein